MIYSAYDHGSDELATNLTPARLRAALHDPAGKLWVDLDRPAPQELQNVLAGIFGFHPLTIQDCLAGNERQKLEDYGDYLFVVLRAPVGEPALAEPSPGTPEASAAAAAPSGPRPGMPAASRARRGGPIAPAVDVEELEMYIGRNFVVTHHHAPLAVIDTMKGRLSRHPDALSHGMDRFAAEVVTAVADGYQGYIDDLDEALSNSFNMIFTHPGDATAAFLLDVRRAASDVFRALSPQEQIMRRLTSEPFGVVRAESQVYFREGLNHASRLADLAHHQRDLSISTIETHMAAVSNRLAQGVRRLTAVATIFLPLTFISSFYGMNFADLPPFRHPIGWQIVVGLMLVAAAVLLAVFRRRDWL